MSPNFMRKQHSTPQNLKKNKQNRQLIIRTQVTFMQLPGYGWCISIEWEYSNWISTHYEVSKDDEMLLNINKNFWIWSKSNSFLLCNMGQLYVSLKIWKIAIQIFVGRNLQSFYHDLERAETFYFLFYSFILVMSTKSFSCILIDIYLISANFALFAFINNGVCCSSAIESSFITNI